MRGPAKEIRWFILKLYHSPPFKSVAPVDPGYLSHFVDPSTIQSCLEMVCNAWVNYLQKFVNETTKLFENAEFPWKGTERATVSSLAAAIIQGIPGSLVVEEGRVPRIDNAGRCDLWASFPDPKHAGTRFSFYLEAKRSDRSKRPKALSVFLKSDKGVSSLFCDYGKSHRNPTNKLSAYADLPKRKHEHFVIGLLVTRLRAVEKDYPDIEAALHEVFENRQAITLRNRSGGEGQKRKRNLGRLPTVAVVVLPSDGRSGFLATFSVLGSTKGLLAK